MAKSPEGLKPSPKRLMLHQKGFGLRKEPAQLVEDGENMDVNILPIFSTCVGLNIQKRVFCALIIME